MNYGLGHGLNFLGCILQIRFAHDVVAIENGIRLVAGNFSRCLLRYAAAKIMEQQSRQSRCLITSAFQAPRKSRTGSPFLVRRKSSGCFPLRSSGTLQPAAFCKLRTGKTSGRSPGNSFGTKLIELQSTLRQCLLYVRTRASYCDGGH